MRPPAGLRLREAHAHLPSLGQSLDLRSLSDCRSLPEALNNVAACVRAEVAAAASTGRRPFVRLTSARVQSWPERRWPTLGELDSIAADTPVVIMSFDHHSAAANSAALAAANLRAGVPVPPNGVVECNDPADPASGPSGLLLEQAAYAAWGAAPEPAPAERVGQVLRALDHLASLGFVEVHDLHSPDWLGPALAQLRREGRLKLKVGLFPNVARVREEAAARSAWESADVFLAGAKLFADGTLNCRTALMIHRYAEPVIGHPRGTAMVSPAAAEDAVRLCDSLGLPLATHAIGDGAVRMMLDVIQRAAPSTRGFRIEHCELIDAADVPRFSALGVICSVQPCHLLTDVEALTRFLPHRLDRVLPLKELLESGLTPGHDLLFGSDVPIVRADPGDSIFAAVHRRRPGDGPDQAIGPRQAISESQAWACFTAP